MLFLILVIVAVVLIIKQAAKETSAQRRAREAREKADEASRRYKELRSKNKSERSAPTPEDILQAAIERAEKRIREAVPHCNRLGRLFSLCRKARTRLQINVPKLNTPGFCRA